jgi:hypothetical protein
VNPLQPHYLVYVQNGGVVRFGFTHPKQILGIFRDLCAGNEGPFEELCRRFDGETQNGADMNAYNNLLENAVRSIENTFKRRVVGSLLESRNAVIPQADKQVTEKTDFELVTWLIIRDAR